MLTLALLLPYSPLFWNMCSLSSSIQTLFIYHPPELMIEVTPWEPSCVDMTCGLSPCTGKRGARCSTCTLSHSVPHSACTVLGGAQELFMRRMNCSFSGTDYSRLGLSSLPFVQPQMALAPCFCFCAFCRMLAREESRIDHGHYCFEEGWTSVSLDSL